MHFTSNPADRFHRHVSHTSPAPARLVVTHAEGSRIFDVEGRSYLDFLSGIAVNNLGHRHPDILRSIREQLDRYLHVMVYGEYVLMPQLLLAEKLAAIAPGGLERTFFANSGAEAVEGALKVARKATGRSRLIAVRNAYHGDTYGALSLAGGEHALPFAPLLPGITRIGMNRLEDLREIDQQVAAVIIEPIQAEAGVVLPSPGYLETLRQRCDLTGSLLIFDEVQTGCGRTGKWFACEHWGVVPDLIVMAKGLGGGLPLGGFIGPPHLMDQLARGTPLSHLTTFGGHPLSCAAGLASLKIIEQEGLLERASALGTRFLDEIGNWRLPEPILADARGCGLLIGLQFQSPSMARRVIQAAEERGLIIGDCLNDPTVVKLSPPLTLNDAEFEEGLELLYLAVQDSLAYQ